MFPSPETTQHKENQGIGAKKQYNTRKTNGFSMFANETCIKPMDFQCFLTKHTLNQWIFNVCERNTNIKHISKTVWMACDPKTFWFIQTWMKINNQVWLKYPSLYLWMNTYIYTITCKQYVINMNKKHIQNPIRKECEHLHICMIHIFVQINRQTRFKFVISCVRAFFQTERHWSNHANIPKNR